MGDDLVVVRSFAEMFAAELAHSALTAAGIPSMIRSDDAGGLYPHLRLVGRRIELIVHDADRSQALEVLDTVARDVPEPDRAETD